MGLLYRALNYTDIKFKPFENGIVSKKEVDKNIPDFLPIEKEDLKLISKKDFKKICMLIKSELVEIDKYQILNDIVKKQEEIQKIFFNIYSDNPEIRVFYNKKLREITSLVSNHMQNGSRYLTDWISFSKNLSCLKKYYLQQSIHQIAVIDNFDDNSLVFDLTDINNILIRLDLSSKEKIENNDYIAKRNYKDLGNKLIIQKLSQNSTAMKYSIRDEEVVIYDHIPQSRIKALLTPYEIDLLLNSNLMDDYFLYSHSEQRHKREKNLCFLKISLEMNDLLDDITKYVLEEHYENCKSLKSLSNSDKEYEKLKNIKRKICEISNTIDMANILKNETPTKFKIMEDIEINSPKIFTK